LARKTTARLCRCNELEARVERVEELARSNRRELDIQFRRLADLQAAVDSPMADGRRRQGNAKGDKGDGRTGGKVTKHKWFSTGGFR